MAALLELRRIGLVDNCINKQCIRTRTPKSCLSQRCLTVLPPLSVGDDDAARSHAQRRQSADVVYKEHCVMVGVVTSHGNLAIVLLFCDAGSLL